MGPFIFRMEVSEVIYPKKMNWLGEWDQEYEDKDFGGKVYELYFPSFEEMNKKIQEITVGCYQYWADAHDDMYGNNVEDLEYHNAYGTWDKEYHIHTSRVYLLDSLLHSIREVMAEGDRV